MLAPGSNEGPGGCSPLLRIEFRVFVRLEAEIRRWDGVIHPYVGVGADARKALPLIEDLLQIHVARWIDPDGDFGKKIAGLLVFRNQLQLVGIYAVDGFLAEPGDLVFILQVLAAGAEAKRDIAGKIGRTMIFRHLVELLVIKLKLAISKGVDGTVRLA